MYYNLLEQPEKLVRDVSIRVKNKQKLRKNALKFAKEYFDGSREEGYGGYLYDGRWINVAKKLISRYKFTNGFKFLDVGCAKGFLMSDLKDQLPDIEVYGVDVSSYAKNLAREDLKENIIIKSCENLPFPNNYFDMTCAINTIHNLDVENCKKAILEMMRVTKNQKNIFIQVDAYTNEKEKKIFEDWVLTAKTCLRPEEWKLLFKNLNYKGDYFWTIIGFDN